MCVSHFSNKVTFQSSIPLWQSCIECEWKRYIESRNWWVSVGVICRSVSSCLFLSLTLTSQKCISSFDHSAINLIVRWEPLSVSINCFKESSPCTQMKNISSIYLHQMRCCSSISCNILSSRSTINRMAYGEANLVHIAVPLNCFKVFSLNWKMLLFKAISAKSTKVSVVTFFSVLAPKNLLSEARPSARGILG